MMEHPAPRLMDENGTMARFRAGRWYDTAKARRMTQFRLGERSDACFVEEVLFKVVPSGRYFLVARGGPDSEHHVKLGPDGRRAGAKNLLPLTTEEMREWRNRRAV